MTLLSEPLPQIERATDFKLKPIRSKGKRMKRKLIKSAVILTVVIAAAFSVVYLVNKFFDKNYLEFHSPVIIQSPIQIKQREVPQPEVLIHKAQAQEVVEPKPLTSQEKILALKHGEIVWKIYGLESTWGQQDSCKAKGKVNGFGYGQNETQWFCYDSLEQVA